MNRKSDRGKSVNKGWKTHTHCFGLSESISYGKTASLAKKLIRKPIAAIIVIMRRFMFLFVFLPNSVIRLHSVQLLQGDVKGEFGRSLQR